MLKLSNAPKPFFRNKYFLRLLVIPLSLMVLVGIFILRDGIQLAGLQGVVQTLSGDDFDGDGIVDAVDLDDDNDGILDVDEGCLACYEDVFVNGDFESGPFPSSYTQTPEDNVNGWETSAPDNKIEIWKTGFSSVPSQSGSYHVEINSSHHAALYQTLCTRPGSVLNWSIWHRGRSGTDVAVVKMGGDLNTAATQVMMTTSKAAWVQYTGSYTVPTGQTTTYFICESVSTGGGSISVGNFIDNVVITESGTGVCLDTDQDGLPDRIDLDSDNDGIVDIVEAGGTDSNGDGMADNANDTDGDGLLDVFDNDQTDGPNASGCTLGRDCDLSSSTSSLFDTNGDGSYEEDADEDGDGRPNFRDIDADADGIVDNIEGQSSNGYRAPTGYDDDQDGIDNAYDIDCNGACTNSDGSTMDVTGVVIGSINTDNVDKPDYLDTDSDNDGEGDMVEAYDTDDDGMADTSPNGLDTDGDGLDDQFDANDLSTDPASNANNTGQHPGSFPDDDPSQAGGEPDWRDTGSSFPVEWLSFEATQTGNQPLLEWATASEVNSAYFEVERATDGQAFEAIGQTQASGQSQDISHYRFVDQTAPATGHLFYRLRQVDLDGAESFSSVEELILREGAPTVQIVLAPNPANERVTLRYTRQTSEALPVHIFTITGQQVYEGSMVEQTGEIDIDVSSWPNGTYFIKLAAQQEDVAKLLVRH